MKNDEIIAKLKELSSDGKITCTDARKIARDLDIRPSEIGRICDELEIKICACELGCF